MSADSWGWDVIVGIPLADWMRADSPEQIEWLIWLRDHPMPPPEPSCICWWNLLPADIKRDTVPGRRDPACRAH